MLLPIGYVWLLSCAGTYATLGYYSYIVRVVVQAVPFLQDTLHVKM